MFFFFFFSSRRRHTRLTCDWSSDVCSSDLVPDGTPDEFFLVECRGHWPQGVAGAPVIDWGAKLPGDLEIGRASCRGRVESLGGAVSLKKKKRRGREWGK